MKKTQSNLKFNYYVEFILLEGGGRTSWEKSWFQGPHIYQQKTDFFSDNSVCIFLFDLPSCIITDLLYTLVFVTSKLYLMVKTYKKAIY